MGPAVNLLGPEQFLAVYLSAGVISSLASLSYEGLGASKKEAKLHASKSLLAEIHRVGFDPITGGLKCPSQNNNNTQVSSLLI